MKNIIHYYVAVPCDSFQDSLAKVVVQKIEEFRYGSS